jgi:L-asparaginase / beta-aspartyl-peptidase
MQKLKKQGGTGGIIAVDRKGNVAMTFNTTGMFRGYVKSGGEKMVGIFSR